MHENMKKPMMDSWVHWISSWNHFLFHGVSSSKNAVSVPLENCKDLSLDQALMKKVRKKGFLIRCWSSFCVLVRGTLRSLSVYRGLKKVYLVAGW